MKKKLTLSNGIYSFSILFAVGVLIKIYLERSGLPEGVCPVNNNSGLVYFSIGLLLVATIISTIIDRKKGKNKLEDEKEHDNSQEV